MNVTNERLKAASRMAILCLAASFLGGIAFGQVLSSSAVKKLTASAKTAADHTKLAKHYEAIAARHETDAKDHEALAEQYSKNPTGHEQKHPM